MAMYETILVPTDGSTVAETAGEYGARLAHRFDAALHVIYVDEERLLPAPGGGESGERAVEEVEGLAIDRGVDVTTAVLEERDGVHRTILEYADDHDVDLLVMGTYGRTGLDRYLIGSVAERTLRESPVPVVTVDEATSVERDLERILVPSDGSAGAMAATDHAIELVTETGAGIHVVHVESRSTIGDETTTVDLSDPDESIGVDAVDDVLERIRAAGVESADVSILGGRADLTILAAAAEHDVDLVVMGTHGRTGIRRHILGSTTERVVRFARVPVLAIRAPRAETATIEYLDYAAVDEHGWSVDDDLFERAGAADLDSPSHGTLEVPRDEYVLDAAEDAGHDWPFYCRAGGCVNCAAVVVEGDLEMDVNRSLSDEEVDEENLRLTCVGTPASDSIKLVYNAKYLDTLRDRVL